MTPPPQPDDARIAAISKYISGPRLEPYLAASNRSTKAALRLYHWNIELSGTVYEALHMFEVALRNAMDQQLSAWNAAQIDARTREHYTVDWLLDPSPLLQRLTRNDITKATQRAGQALRPRQRTPGHADILTHLSFGTWRFLLPDSDPGRQLLWSQALISAFPNLDTPAEALTSAVAGIHKLRNRVAHLEPLLRTTSIRHEVLVMRTVLRSINPQAEEWFTSRQRVTYLIKQRPGL